MTVIPADLALKVLRELRKFRPGAPVTVADLKACSRELAEIPSCDLGYVLRSVAQQHPYNSTKHPHDRTYWTWGL